MVTQDDGGTKYSYEKTQHDRQRMHNEQCKAGDRNHCSGWDNYAWQNIPSAFGIQGGVNVQIGIGLEISFSLEFAATFNWRSGQIAVTRTTEPGGYFGAPHGAAVSGYYGFHEITGMSDLSYLDGPDAFIEGTLSADDVATAGIAIEASQSLQESSGLQFIDPVSQMPQNTVEVNAVYGVNAIPNAVDVGATFGESNSTIIWPIIDLYDWFE